MKNMQTIRNNSLYEKELKEIWEQYDFLQTVKGKTVLITGATGMIGTALIDTLMYASNNMQAEITIIAVGRDIEKAQERLGTYWRNSQFHFLQHNVNEPFPLDVKCDVIIHGASNTHPRQYAEDPIGTIEANVIGTKNILELATKQKNCRVFFLSSVEIYGEDKVEKKSFKEENCGYIDCNTLRAGYPESKRLGEALCQAYIAAKGLDVVIPRLSRIYGPTMLQEDSKAIAQFIKKACAREDIILKSEGTQRYSYTYVMDIVSAILYLLQYGKTGEAYNIAGHDSDISLKELASYLAELTETNIKYELPDAIEQRGYSSASVALLDMEKISTLGWKSRYGIEQGLKQTIEILKGC